MDKHMNCREHNFLVVEVEGDGRGGWRAWRLLCSHCLHSIFYKDILKLHNAKHVNGEIISD